ncbi:hypothetical protein [Prosthecobacter sp.]|uniref:hypothetical protein n=1 Tax=Prosthecobacter sp. TaxID=1965333 RepID=UPI001D2E68D4|nr:hypothetical protein [Prosthecobacter sp.]MCB1276552.1 hypothetical protein [Prosthecobacter sp.]
MRSPAFIQCLTLLACGALTCVGQDTLFDEPLWARDGLTRSTNAFARVTRVPHPEDATVSALHCERESRWWGRLLVVRRDGDNVKSFVPLPQDYLDGAGHYVRDLSWRKIRDVGWVLQVFTSTHRGNGSLWLLEFKDGRSRTLMTTRAVADNYERWFDRGQLQIEHLDGDVSKPIALRLHGIEHIINEAGCQLDKKVDEQWVWDGAKRVFVIQNNIQSPSK